MPFNSAQEAFEEFQRTGAYANSAKHFGGSPEEAQAMFGEYKHMIPHDVLKGFREKVAGNEQRAIQGMQQGLSREQMGIYNIPEQGQALWRRLGMGLGTGLDMNKAYNWGGGGAREIGTTDMAKWGTSRPITDVERQRYADFSAAGSPEAFWSSFRQNQIKDLLAQGAIAQDPRTGGYYNPGPGGGDRYGAHLEGYNFGSRNPGGAVMGAPPPRSNAAYQQPSYSSPFAPGAAPQGAAPPTFSFPPGGNTGITGGMSPQIAPQGPPSAAPAQLSAYGAKGSGSPENFSFYPSPGTQTPVPSNAVGPTPPQPAASNHPSPNGTIFELPPGNAGIPSGMGQQGTGGSPFGPNPVPIPTGNGVVGLPGQGNGQGGTNTPSLPGFNLPAFGVNPWDANSPWGNQLQSMGGMDVQGQGFTLDRAMQEYLRSLPKENLLNNLYSNILGVDPATGQPLTGEAANVADRQTFGLLAPQANRLAGDIDSAMERLRQSAPAGGARDMAAGELLRAGQAGMLGSRQALQGQALGGLTDMMNREKGFDPFQSGAAEALLGADVNTRGQDLSTLLGARGQDLEALLGQRGQDVNWGLGWGNIGSSQMMNLWDAYLRGRGQDMDLYQNLRGQDLQRQAAIEAARAAKPSWWQSLLGAAGGAAASYFTGGYGAGK